MVEAMYIGGGVINKIRIINRTSFLLKFINELFETRQEHCNTITFTGIRSQTLDKGIILLRCTQLVPNYIEQEAKNAATQ